MADVDLGIPGGLFPGGCSRGSLTPVAAPKVFLVGGWIRSSGFGTAF